MTIDAKTVLVVDDDNAVRRATCRILMRAGYSVLEARNGHEALATHEDHGAVDMLLTDVVMPKMSGDELIVQLLERQPDLKCAYMTGYATKRMVEGTGDHVCLPKPFRDTRLLLLVRRVLDSAEVPMSMRSEARAS